jgi:hypothetical protein
MTIAARHSRTRLVDGSGEVLWNDPSCQHARQVDDWWLGSGRYAVIDPPGWLRLPVRANAWRAIGIVSGLRIQFAPPVAKSGSVREILEADPSARAGRYCIYEEFYRSPGDPAAGGVAYWSRMQINPPPVASPVSATSGFPLLTRILQRPVNVDNSGWPTPAPIRFVPAASFFPPRPPGAEIHYRSGVLTEFGAGNKSGYAAIRDDSGRTFGYFTGWPINVDGKQTHCAIPPRHGLRFDPKLCEGGWPTDMVIGLTRVRLYYWHAATPWGRHVEVTDRIDRTP